MTATYQGEGTAPSTSVYPIPGSRDPKLAERIASVIEQRVIASGWQVGSPLGSEDELMRSLGVGRAVLREALRLLERRQVATVRRGRAGGLAVAEPTPSAVLESLAIYLDYARVAPSDIFETRRILELQAVRLAATDVEESHLAQLRAALAEGETATHSVLAAATGNRVLSLFLDSLSAIGLIASQQAPELGAASSEDAAARSEVIDAVIQADAHRASTALAAHLEALAPNDRAAPDTPYFTVLQRSLDFSSPLALPSRRSGDALAAKIFDTVVSEGWQVGLRLGFEADLMAELAVGRSQFREAIRLLEHHSVVRTLRGSRGGVVVAAPDGRGLARAASAYLTYRGATAEEVAVVREELEVAALSRAMANLDQAARTRLTDAVDRERGWPDEDFRSISHDLHRVLGELSGNRTLALLLSVTMQLTAERLHRASEIRPKPANDPIRHAHTKVVAAILDGDLPLATRRLRKHLRALSAWSVVPVE